MKQIIIKQKNNGTEFIVNKANEYLLKIASQRKDIYEIITNEIEGNQEENQGKKRGRKAKGDGE